MGSERPFNLAAGAMSLAGISGVMTVQHKRQCGSPDVFGGLLFTTVHTFRHISFCLGEIVFDAKKSI